MTKEQAQRDTVKRFTNLIDGKVLPFASVASIINHYELLLNGSKVNASPSHDAIIQNFNEEWIKELENEASDYDGE
jgi:hypothetical protein